jgi:flavin-dependent dehydrogenase
MPFIPDPASPDGSPDGGPDATADPANRIPGMPPSRSSVDVVVVGARAAGAATAMLLARQGLSVMLVDRSVIGSDTLSTHALMRGGVLQLSRWGVLDRVVAAATPPIKRTTFRYGGEELVITIKPSHGVDTLYAPRRTILDAILVRAARRAGAQVYEGLTVTQLVRSGARVTGVVAATDDGRRIEIGARIVVGADGVRSTIARLVGAPFTRLGAHTTAVTYGYWSGLRTDGYEWIFRPQGAAGVIPTNDGKACVYVGGTPERIGRGGLDVLTTVADEVSPELAERLRRGVAPAGTRTWGGRPGYMRQCWGAGWALVGDAGYYKDPISAHGLTDAFRDAELLARSIVGLVAGETTEAHAMGEYQSTRDRLSIRLFDVVDEIAGLRWDEVEIGDLLMQLNSAMADEVETLANLDPVNAR